MPVLVNPECRDGKHRNCDGVALDVEQDEFVDCPCTCHPTPKENTMTTTEAPSTYTGRALNTETVQKKEATGDSYWITAASGWTAGCPKEVYDLLEVGSTYELETRNFSTVTGWRIDGRWYARKSDEDLAAEHQAWLAKWEQDKRDQLAANREAWELREAALPDWIRARLTSFHSSGGEAFALEGWGYELAVAELAVMYAKLGAAGIQDKDSFTVEDSDEIREYANREGTSGNQHGMALALAKAHVLDGLADTGGTVSALTPLTGNPDYRPEAVS